MRIVILLLSLLAMVSAPARAAWQRATSEHFTVYADASEQWVRDYVLELERFDMLARQVFRLKERPAGMRLTVFVMNTLGEVRAVHGAGSNVGGFYAAGSGGAMMVVPQETRNPQAADTVLRHEYAHHLMMQYFPVAYPGWYVEGFADFLSTASFDKRDAPSLGAPPVARLMTLKNSVSLGIERVLTTNVEDQLEGRQRSAFYAESWLLTHYLSVSPERPGQLQNFLALLNGGKAPLDAAREAFGDLARLESDVSRYRREAKFNYYHLDQPFRYAGSVSVEALDPAAAATMRERIALTRGGADEKSAPLIASLEAALAKDPKSADTLALLARANLNMRRNDAAEAAADKALAIAPNHSRAAMWKALAMMGRLRDAGNKDAEAWKAVRRVILQANKADPNDPVPLRENYRIYRLIGLAPSPTAKQGLAQAYNLLPQNVSLRFEYAQLLTMEGQYDSAIALLRPTANAPHAPQAAAAAKRMIGNVEKAKASQAIAEVESSEAEAQGGTPEG